MSKIIKQHKKRARAIARANGTSHQAELDAIARSHGHPSWGPFQATLRQDEDEDEGPPCLRAFIDAIKLDEETAALVEDAINGYLVEDGVGIEDYARGYEYRGDGGDITPNERQRSLISKAIACYLDLREKIERIDRPLRVFGTVRPVGTAWEAPYPRIRPVSMPRETALPIIRPVKPYSPPPPLPKPVEMPRLTWPEIRRVETPQERDREAEEDYLRTKAKMDMLQQKLEEHRSRRDDDTE